MLRYLFSDFHIYSSIGKSEKRIWKTFLKNSGLARARIIIFSKKKTALRDNSFANPFSDFPIQR